MTITMTDARERFAATRGADHVARDYAVTGITLRAKNDDPDSTIRVFNGHAAVTDRGYDMYGGPSSDAGGWEEFVDQGAFKKTLSEGADVAFLINHQGMTLARTTSGTLRLAEDKVGLKVAADLDVRQHAVNDLAIAMERGDVNEMSFAFRIIKEAWLTEDGDEVPWWDMSGVYRHIKEVSLQKGDVSAVNYGANPYTDAALRSAILGGYVDAAAVRRALDDTNTEHDDAAADEAEERRVEEHNRLLAELFAKKL